MSLFDSIYNSYGSAIDSVLSEKDLSQKWLAENLLRKGQKLSSLQSQVNRWIKGQPVSQSYQKRINNLLDISVVQESDGKWHIYRTETVSPQVRAKNTSYATQKSIPYYKEVKAGAGNGRIITPDDESDMIPINFPLDYITQELKANPSDLIMMRVWSDSMEPEIDDGDVIFVNRNVTRPFEGKIYIIRMNESYLCKYLQELPGNKIRVFSENERYQSFEIQMGDDSQEDFEIYGRVMFSGQKR